MISAERQLIASCLTRFGQRYLHGDVLAQYPEVRIIAPYLQAHFAEARMVLDLGFGAGLWFYASFLPSLQRLDGFDLYPEALAEAERVRELDYVPEGYRAAHAHMGQNFSWQDLRALVSKQGRLLIQDYRTEWPPEISRTRYDLVTEHGGGLAELASEHEFMEVVAKCSAVLEPGGHFFFANFVMQRPSDWEKRLGDRTRLELGSALYRRAAERAGLVIVDLHESQHPIGMPDVRTFIYGYAKKPEQSR